MTQLKPLTDRIEHHLAKNGKWPSGEQIREWCRSLSIPVPLKYYSDGVQYEPYGKVKLAEHVSPDDRSPYTVVLMFESGERRGETVLPALQEKLDEAGSIIWPGK